MESSIFLWDNFFNSFFDSIVKVTIPGVEIPVVSDHSNPVFLVWSSFCHFDRMVAFPHGGAVTTSSVYEQVTSGMNIKKVGQIVNFSSDDNPERAFTVMFNDFFPCEPGVCRVELFLFADGSFFLFDEF